MPRKNKYEPGENNRNNLPKDDWRCPDCNTLNDGKVRNVCREITCQKPRPKKKQ